MLALKELERTLGLSEDQVRARVAVLRESFDDVVVKGAHGRLLVKDRGIALLQKLHDLEGQGHSLQTAAELIKEDLRSDQPNGTNPAPKEPEAEANLVRTLQETNALLKEQLAFKDGEIERLHDLLQRQLPPAKEGEARRLSRWEALKLVLTGR